MTAEWLTAYASAGTLAVITATAIAALLQLGHMRGGNQIVGLNEFRERIESPEFRAAENFVSYELPDHLKDPDSFPDIFKLPFAEQYRAISVVANLFENMGLFVKYNVIDRKLACDVWGYIVLRNWTALAPVITYTRQEVGNDALWENFEYLAMLCQQFKDRHQSVFPAGAARMPEDRTLVSAAKAR